MAEGMEAITILVADDDEDDRLIAAEALEEARLANTVRFVQDGEELLQYLRREAHFADEEEFPWPGLILLDLNMPRMDGRQALEQIKKDAKMKRIPVVVLTTSKAHEDVVRSYDLGVNSFISKPVTFEQLVRTMKTLGDYWFGIVTLPED